MLNRRVARRSFGILMCMLMCISGTALVYSFGTVSGDTVNFLTMSSYKNQIEEQYEIPDQVNPSGEITKIVNVSNTGTVDTIVRVSVEKAFGIRKADGTFLEDKTLDPDMIEIVYNTRYWQYREDGYHYYKRVLKAGETTKEALFTSYRLSEKAGNEYKGKDAQIVVTMESVQAQGDAVSAWGVTHKELGIVRPEGIEGDTTRVNYLGMDAGFDISRTKADLFTAFKNLLPGCGRTQRIEVHNHSDQNLTMYLRAEAVDQEEMSAEQLKMVKLLLNRYAIIEIRDKNGEIYTGPVSGNLSGNGATMKHDISLGRFAAKEGKELTVTLSLSPEMDNKFQKLTGKVKWVFTAVEDEKKISVTSELTPKTGDDTPIVVWAVLFAGSALLLAAMMRLEWQRRTGEET